MITRVNRYRLVHVLLIFALSVLPILSQATELVIIGHKTITVDSITIKQAKRIWLGKLKKLGAAKVTVVDQVMTNSVYKLFYSKVIKKNPSQLKAYWAKKTFTGKAFPPIKLADDTAILKWVASTPGALGYVQSSAINDSVKSLLTAK